MNNETKKGYIAGKLFKKGDQNQRILEKELLSKEIPSVEWFNPLTDNPSNDKSKLPDANSIFVNDTNRVIDSEYIVAELDDEDSGTMMELGIAYGINFMLGIIDGLLERGCTPSKAIEIVYESIPFKKIYGHLTDIRTATAGEYDGKYVPVGFNQYVLGGVEQIGEVYNDFDKLIEGIKSEV
jgi:hypothetical protein